MLAKALRAQSACCSSFRFRASTDGAYSTLINRTLHLATRQNNSTVEESEVEKHTRLEKEWWSPDGIMKALHAMNQIRVPLVRDGLLGKNKTDSASPLRGLKVLDVGCGGGILSEPLARLGAEVTGVDASSALVELAKTHAEQDLRLKQNKPTYINTTIEEHSAEYKDHYDGVVASEIIEHVSNKELFVHSCVCALKPGGSIFFTTPNKTYLSWLGGILIAENCLKIVPKGHHNWDLFTTPTELSHLVEKNNCKIKAIYGGFYSFLNNKWFFTSSQHFLFILHAVKN